MRLFALIFILISGCTLTKKYPGEPVVFDPDKGTVMDHVAEDIHTIIYLGENWCSYCQRAKLIFHKNAKPLQGLIKFVIVDLDQHETIAIGNYSVMQSLAKLQGIPKFIVTKNSRTILYVGNGDPVHLIRLLLQSP